MSIDFGAKLVNGSTLDFPSQACYGNLLFLDNRIKFILVMDKVVEKMGEDFSNAEIKSFKDRQYNMKSCISASLKSYYKNIELPDHTSKDFINELSKCRISSILLEDYPRWFTGINFYEFMKYIPRPLCDAVHKESTDKRIQLDFTKLSYYQCYWLMSIHRFIRDRPTQLKFDLLRLCYETGLSHTILLLLLTLLESTEYGNKDNTGGRGYCGKETYIRLLSKSCIYPHPHSMGIFNCGYITQEALKGLLKGDLTSFYENLPTPKVDPVELLVKRYQCNGDIHNILDFKRLVPLFKGAFVELGMGLKESPNTSYFNKVPGHEKDIHKFFSHKKRPYLRKPLTEVDTALKDKLTGDFPYPHTDNSKKFLAAVKDLVRTIDPNTNLI